MGSQSLNERQEAHTRKIKTDSFFLTRCLYLGMCHATSGTQQQNLAKPAAPSWDLWRTAKLAKRLLHQNHLTRPPVKTVPFPSLKPPSNPSGETTNRLNMYFSQEYDESRESMLSEICTAVVSIAATTVH